MHDAVGGGDPALRLEVGEDVVRERARVAPAGPADADPEPEEILRLATLVAVGRAGSSAGAGTGTGTGPNPAPVIQLEGWPPPAEVPNPASYQEYATLAPSNVFYRIPDDTSPEAVIAFGCAMPTAKSAVWH